MACSLKSGVSLVELCIAILILTLATTLIMTFSRNSLLLSSDSRGAETARALASEKYSELLVQSLPSQNGCDTVTIGKWSHIRNWVITDTVFIRRALITVTYQVGNKKKSVRFAGALN